MTNQQFKFNLQNASAFLLSLKKKHSRISQSPERDLSQTYIQQEDDSISLSGKPQLVSYNDQSKNHQEVSEIKYDRSESQPNQKPNHFCQRLILTNLQQTIRIYQEDLNIFVENRSFLESKIQLISGRIQKLRDFQQSNKKLRKQNAKNKEYLSNLMDEHSESLVLFFKCQLKQQELYNKIRSKIRMLVDEVKSDDLYNAYVDDWNQHIFKSRHISKKIIDIVKSTKKKEKIIHGRNEPNEMRASINDMTDLQLSQKKPVKKITEAEKASLLGDLKSFAKNFKFPS